MSPATQHAVTVRHELQIDVSLGAARCIPTILAGADFVLNDSAATVR